MSRRTVLSALALSASTVQAFCSGPLSAGSSVRSGNLARVLCSSTPAPASLACGEILISRRLKTEMEAGGGKTDGGREKRRAARKARKEAAAEAAAAREKKSGGGGAKPCSLCAAPVHLLIRCQTDVSKTWNMVCGKCWNKVRTAPCPLCRFRHNSPQKRWQVSGGVPDGDAEHPFYRYGGLWKSRALRNGDVKLRGTPLPPGLAGSAGDVSADSE
jgi:hypothetical protein